ncbi:MAG: type IV toxin-antitoxin system AbiEi family antitoxin domain-containing protein [Ignavibacteriaceae bacterium]|nr:type IV toxin-antitoxin system AbiEi family antitoxin domain-containing protein [Ignavibacteriaceae bacterium]
MEKTAKLLNKNRGYARMQDFKSAGIHTREVASALQRGTIEKFAPGRYKLIRYDWDEFAGFTDIAALRPDAVICLESAAEYHGLTTLNPSVITVAIPRNTRKFSLEHPPIRIHFFSPKQYKTGILTGIGSGGKFQVYSAEKTIIDLFRFRNKTGMDILLEVLKNYTNRKDRNINLLTAYAKQFRVYKEFFPYIQAMVA